MLPFYADLNSDLELVAQETLSGIIQHYMDVHRDDEMDFSNLFPEIVYSTKRDKCDKAVEEIELWSRDAFKRSLSPLHEYALYKILNWAKDIEEDFKYENDESTFFSHLPKKKTDYLDERNDWELSDLASMDFYFENCFLDHDFLDVPLFINSLESVPIKLIERQLGIDLKRYVDLIPPDIEEKLHEYYFKDNYEISLDDPLLTLVFEGVNHFIHNLVKESGYKLLWDENGKPRGEKYAQTLFFNTVSKFFQDLSIDISPEANIGRGPVDFKFTKDKQKVLVEVKLARNTNLLHGLKFQLVEYLFAEKIKNAVFLIICYTTDELSKAQLLYELADEVNDEHEVNIKVFIADASNKKQSASKLNKKPTRYN